VGGIRGGGGIEAWAYVNHTCQSNRRNPRPTTCQSHAPAKSEGTLWQRDSNSTWPPYWSLTHRSPYWSLHWSSDGHRTVKGSGHSGVNGSGHSGGHSGVTQADNDSISTSRCTKRLRCLSVACLTSWHSSKTICTQHVPLLYNINSVEHVYLSDTDTYAQTQEHSDT